MGGNDKEATGHDQHVPSKCTLSMLSEGSLRLDIRIILEMGEHSHKTSSLGPQKKIPMDFCDGPLRDRENHGEYPSNAETVMESPGRGDHKLHRSGFAREKIVCKFGKSIG